MNDNLWQAAAAAIGTQGSAPPLRHYEESRQWPLSFAQERICVLSATEPVPACYNVALAWWVQGQLRAEILDRAMGILLERHHALRSRLRFANDRWVAELAPLEPFHTECQWTTEPLIEAARAALRQPFVFDAPPHLRASLFQGVDRSLLLFCAHQTAVDGWSQRILAREFQEIYTALSENRTPDLPRARIQYGDFAAWQRALWDQMPDSDPGLTYWREILSQPYEALQLPCYTSRRAETGPAAVLPFLVPYHLAMSLRVLARHANVSLFVVFLSALQGLLSRYTNQTRIIVFASVAARFMAEIRNVVGLFANVIPFGTDFSGQPNLGEVFERVRESVLGGYAHQTVPLERLLADIASPPPVQVLLLYHNHPQPTLTVPGASLTPAAAIDNGLAKTDIVVDVAETSNGLSGRWKYRSDRFDPALMRRMRDNLLVLLNSYISSI